MPKPSKKSKTKIRILLADDHHIRLCRGEAQTLIQKHKPDVAVLDIQMPKASGIEVTRSHFPEKLGD
jgi:CheY-like chemotaxis protein